LVIARWFSLALPSAAPLLTRHLIEYLTLMLGRARATHGRIELA